MGVCRRGGRGGGGLTLRPAQMITWSTSLARAVAFLISSSASITQAPPILIPPPAATTTASEISLQAGALANSTRTLYFFPFSSFTVPFSSTVPLPKKAWPCVCVVSLSTTSLSSTYRFPAPYTARPNSKSPSLSAS